VELDDFTEAFERVVLGAERSITVSQEERERTAYHESGHALLGMLEPGADPVRKVSIVPRGYSLGVTLQSPDGDRYALGSQYLLGRIVGLMGGRAAEEIVYGDITTGVESDLEQATRLARMMVGRWGMSELIGPVSAISGGREDPNLFPGTGGPASEETHRLVDQEVRRILDDCYVRALAVLRSHRRSLDELSAELLKRETLDEADAYAVAGVEAPVSARTLKRDGAGPDGSGPD
jgi:cell division protease FtsH